MLLYQYENALDLLFVVPSPQSTRVSICETIYLTIHPTIYPATCPAILRYLANNIFTIHTNLRKTQL